MTITHQGGTTGLHQTYGNEPGTQYFPDLRIQGVGRGSGGIPPLSLTENHTGD